MPMDYGRLEGLHKPVSRLVLGCGRFRPEHASAAETMLDAFVAAGGTALDTAHVYGREGASERAVGAWLARRRNRERMVLITKGAHPDAQWRPRVTPEVIGSELSESLERLQTDHVDVYLLHRDDPEAAVGPIVECLNSHVAAGRIRVFGVSNWSPARIEIANAYARDQRLQGFAASSPHLALAVGREPAHLGYSIISGDPPALDAYRRTGLPLMAWSAQANGFFSERATSDDPETRRRFRRYDAADNWERRRRACELAARLNCTPTQVALAWVLRQPMEVYAIIGPGSVAHLQESLGAQAVSLSAADLAWLNLETG